MIRLARDVRVMGIRSVDRETGFVQPSSILHILRPLSAEVAIRPGGLTLPPPKGPPALAGSAGRGRPNCMVRVGSSRRVSVREVDILG
jgi:hypothetical protein